MIPIRRLLAILTVAFLAIDSVSAERTADDRGVDNIATFARVYGYVRFFYPSDAAASLDWDAFAMLGVETTRNASDAAALQRALAQLFHPIAPTLRFSGPAGDDPVAPADASHSEARFIHWQHVGVKLHSDPGPYHSRRVIGSETTGEHARFFADTPHRATYVEKDIGQSIRIRMPLELPLDPQEHTLPVAAADFDELKTKLGAIGAVSRDAATDETLHAAGVIVAWNVFQHFHPYLDSIHVDWSATLRPALRRALAAKSREEYYRTLSEMVAYLQDGHGYVYGRDTKMGGLPIRVAVIDNQLVITATRGDTPLRRGDVIVELDGSPAMDIELDREHYVSGSPQLRRFRAFNQFGEGTLDSVAQLEILRDGKTVTFDLPRPSDRRGFFFSSVTPYEFSAFAEVRPGIFYVNLRAMGRTKFAETLPDLERARGIIFDERWDGRIPPGGGAEARDDQLQVSRDIIPHLIDQTVQASPMRIPQVVEPDRQHWQWSESTWLVEPTAPRFGGGIVFINDAGVVSYGETCMAMIADYHLATLVGEPTAGTNGNVNFIHLPGGFRIMWTGMEVLKHDHSPFYTVGFVPDYPVRQTLTAVKEGRDEFLERAIAVIENAASASGHVGADKGY
jgi:C-terminal processing protease CtpA/Prc